MNRSIYDLLDGYEDGTLTPEGDAPLSPERIRALTLQRLPERKRARPGLRFAAVVAAAAALSVTVLAAAGPLGIADRFRDFFGALSAPQSEAVEQMGAPLEMAVTSNGATVTPLAILVDENVCYLRLRVEAPEGTVLGALPEGWSYKLYGDEPDELLRFAPVDVSPYVREVVHEDGSKDKAYGFACGTAEFDLPDDDPTDNVIETVLRFCADQAMAEKGMRFNDGNPKRLTLAGLWIMSPELEFKEVFTGEFTFAIDSRFESFAQRLDCTGAEWTDGRGVRYAYDELLLSPLSLSFHYASDLPMPPVPTSPEEAREMQAAPPDLPTPNGFALVRKDGSELNCAALELGSDNTGYTLNDLDWRPYWSQWDYVVFDEPLVLSEIAYVRCGETLIPVNP